MDAKKFVTATTAAVIAAAAVSACAPASEKPWPNAGAGSSTAAVAKPVTHTWISLAAQPVPVAERDTTQWRLRFGATAAPGTGVWEGAQGCTLGPVVAPEMSSSGRGFLTAGHCDIAGTATVVAYADAGHADPRPVGVYTPAPPAGRPTDVVSLWTSPGVAGAPSIAGHRVAGVMTQAAVKALPTAWTEGATATPVCIYGAVSGLLCGELAFTDRLTVRLRADHGDSGAPMFVVDETTGDVTLIGVLTDSNLGEHGFGEFLEPALDDLDANVVVDPAAATAVKGDPIYSDRVVTPS